MNKYSFVGGHHLSNKSLGNIKNNINGIYSRNIYKILFSKTDLFFFPRGMTSSLLVKKKVKKIYIYLINFILKLKSNCTIIYSSKNELNNSLLKSKNYLILCDYYQLDKSLEQGVKRKKNEIIYVNRIDKNKGLLKAVKILESKKVSIILNVYGPIYSKEYYSELMNYLRTTKYVNLNYHGVVSHDVRIDIIKRYKFSLYSSEEESLGLFAIDSILSGNYLYYLNQKLPFINKFFVNVGANHLENFTYDIEINNEEKDFFLSFIKATNTANKVLLKIKK
ncbi:MAG: hypothetical protein CBB97_02655 [Candidatus Endolissoclinum sp. TMED37]|nr:MAG: hypothetical protein CBB97_02655 [Candidatus Endolissoclinum sp. TMED37]|tara:strand:- start:144 stop:980 length:837 start_codon:yes stop_codon:yes gene_type:complete